MRCSTEREDKVTQTKTVKKYRIYWDDLEKLDVLHEMYEERMRNINKYDNGDTKVKMGVTEC
jgi:CRISPR/Cas system-associated endonuclease Cas1